MSRSVPSARERARNFGKLLRRNMAGKTPDQRKSYARGYWQVCLDSDPKLADYREDFEQEALS